jgi:hypothetical protein
MKQISIGAFSCTCFCSTSEGTKVNCEVYAELHRKDSSPDMENHNKGNTKLPLRRTDPVSRTLCFLVSRIPDDGQSPKTQ